MPRLTSLNQLIHAGDVVDGAWELTPRHQVRYRRRGGDETVVLMGDFVAAEATGLMIQVTGQQTGGDLVGHTVTLRGRWEADDRNRLAFLVEREGGRHDRLTLGGAWAVGPRHEIVYRYQRHEDAVRRAVQTVTFHGAWDLTQARRLTYVLDADSDSAFRFRGAFQTPSVLAKTGEIRYQLGIEVEGRRRVQTVTLFGKWKLSRDLGLAFEIPYADGEPRTMTFGATYRLAARQTIAATLKAPDGKPVGLEVLLTREFLRGQGEAFVRLRRALGETTLEAGLRFPW